MQSRGDLERGQRQDKRVGSTPTKMEQAGGAYGIKATKSLAIHAWDELLDIVKAEIRMEVKIYEKALGNKIHGGLGGHMRAWYAAAQKYAIGLLDSVEE